MHVFDGEASNQVQGCIAECQNMAEDDGNEFFDVISRSEALQHVSKYKATVILDDDVFKGGDVKVTMFVTVPGSTSPFQTTSDTGKVIPS